MKKYYFFIILFLIFSVSFVSVGYSAFNTTLSVSGDAIVRRDADIRITNLELISKSNGGAETYNSSYSRSLTSMSVSLPNTNSTVVYRVTVSNNSHGYFTLKSISESIYSNRNVSYSISGIQTANIYQGSSLTFNITFTTSSTNQSCNLTLKFDFEIISKTSWDFDYTNGEQTFNVPYNGKYKLEVWGAQGGTILNTLVNTSYYGGYGGYSVGEVTLSANTPLYINVGGEGKSCLVYGSTTAGTKTCGDDGGYNGGGNTRQYVANTFYGSGGGATHIAKVSGVLSNLENYKGTYSSTNGTYDSSSILIVAGGGGGASSYSGLSYAAHGGAGGGYIGSNSEPVKVDRDVYCTAGSQNAAGDGSDSGNMGFGRGASITRYVGPGAGGGWYGGGSSELYGCGGSSYIGSSLLTNKAMYCYNCSESTSLHIKTIKTTNISENPTSNYVKKGNGYSRITLLPAN